ncbi:MAG: DUF4870 domain-containing protein [Deltaproteobacteria bacterium]|nr:DUF4870 domain-containing protein [Deltaproteobacteria bacterium]
MTQTISQSDRSFAIVAHLSGLAGYIIPFGGAIVPICMMLLLTDRPQIVTIARQALFLNLAMFVAAIGAILCILTLVLIPVGWLILVLLGPIAVILPIIGAIKAANGELYRYPIVGGMA